MVSSVRSRPNHYEVLGLQPAANDGEIRRAFAKRMGLVSAHPLGDLAQILLAYETLRNPSKRRAYDRSRAAGPKLRPHQWTAAARPRWAQFMPAAPTSSGAQPRSGDGLAPDPHLLAGPRPGAPAEPSPTTTIGMSLRELAKAEPLGTSGRAAKPKDGWNDEQGTDAGLEQVIAHIRTAGRVEKERSRQLKFGVVDWRRPLFLLGGLVLGAGLLGALLGLSVRESASPAHAESASAAPRMLRHVAATRAAPVQASVEKQMKQPDRAGPSQTRPRHGLLRHQPVALVETVIQGTPDGSASGVSSLLAGPDKPATARPVAADLPLSNSLVAHTIERIGYACGQVAAAAPAEGEAQGVYNITCSSGQTYQARPVRGRYRFRRLDR